MADELREYHNVKAAMLALLESTSPGERSAAERLASYEAFSDNTQRAAIELAKSAEFFADGTVTWQGYRFYIQTRHPIRHWWGENWFPAIVAFATIVSGGAVAVTSVLTMLGFGPCS